MSDRPATIVVVSDNESQGDSYEPAKKRTRRSENTQKTKTGVIDLTNSEEFQVNQPYLVRFPLPLPILHMQNGIGRIFLQQSPHYPHRTPNCHDSRFRLEITLDDDDNNVFTRHTSSHNDENDDVIEVQNPNACDTTNINNPNTQESGLAQLECSICLGKVQQITATVCGHIYCLVCIRKAIQTTKCCPLCKKKLSLRCIHPLYV